jgi:hypothetical protein
VWAEYFTKVPQQLRSLLAECILTLTLGHHADFHRRIVHVIVDQYPAKLFLIAKRGRGVKCDDRLRVVRHLLATPGHQLEVTARSVKANFAAELQIVVGSDGLCVGGAGLLWLQIAIWCEAMPSDTGYIEGINNMIISAASFAPAMKLPLLSSRVVGRCALLPEGFANSSKVSHMAPAMNEMVRRSTCAVSMGNRIMDDLDRFATPTPRALAPTAAIPCRPSPFSATALTWARHHNAKWVSHIRRYESFPLRCLIVLPGLPDPSGVGVGVGYLAPHTHGWSAHLCQCEVLYNFYMALVVYGVLCCFVFRCFLSCSSMSRPFY